MLLYAWPSPRRSPLARISGSARCRLLERLVEAVGGDAGDAEAAAHQALGDRVTGLPRGRASPPGTSRPAAAGGRASRSSRSAGTSAARWPPDVPWPAANRATGSRLSRSLSRNASAASCSGANGSSAADAAVSVSPGRGPDRATRLAACGHRQVPVDGRSIAAARCGGVSSAVGAVGGEQGDEVVEPVAADGRPRRPGARRPVRRRRAGRARAGTPGDRRRPARCGTSARGAGRAGGTVRAAGGLNAR